MGLVRVIGALGIVQDGYYRLFRKEIQKTISFSVPIHHSLVDVWPKIVYENSARTITGWANDFSENQPHDKFYTPTNFCEIVSCTSNSVTLRTYIYDIYHHYLGNIYLGTFPASSANNVSGWMFTILTKNNRIKFATVADYSGSKTITFENDTLFAHDEFSEFFVKDSTKIILPDSAILKIPDDYTLHFSGKTTSLKLNPNSKIIFGENSKIIFDSSATLIANGAIFCSSDTSNKWDGIILSNSGNDSIINCMFSDAKTAITITNGANFSTFNRVIKGNTFNVPSGGEYNGIYGENNYRLLIQDNVFNMPEFNTASVPPRSSHFFPVKTKNG